LNTKKITRLLELAKRASKHSTCKNRKMGAVLVQNGKVVAFGFNKAKTHPAFVDTLRTTTHAEISACINFGKDRIDNGTMFVYREDVSGFPSIARPCSICEKYMSKIGITKVYYTIKGISGYIMEYLT
jgi:deoxycytidylate deaminase